jgi:cbb3-type cytochrome oxidase subunit 1
MRSYAVSGAAWALVAALALLMVAIDLALGLHVDVAVLGVGRLIGVVRHSFFFGAVSLPLAGFLLAACAPAPLPTSVARWSRRAVVLWNAGMVVGVVTILVGYMSPVEWSPAPAVSLGIVWLGAAAWSLALWMAIAARPGRPAAPAWFALAAAVGLLVYGALAVLATGGLGGAAQALAGSLAGRGLLGVWAGTAAIGVAASWFPLASGRPLFGRRSTLVGLWLWVVAAAFSAPRDLLPDLVPTWLVTPVALAGMLLVVAASAAAVALFGSFIGSRRTRWPSDASTLFIASGVLGVLLGAIAMAVHGPDAARVTQFTSWDPAAGLAPAFVSLTLVAVGASYVLTASNDAHRGPVDAMHHLALALLAAVLLLAPVWPLGLAEAATGPLDAIVRARSAALLPGAILTLVASVVWVLNVVARERRRSAATSADAPPDAPADAEARSSSAETAAPGMSRGSAVGPLPEPAAGSGPSAAAVVGTAGTIVAVALFVTLFLPLVDASFVGGTPRTAMRELDEGSLPHRGRRLYVAEGCVVCHTQRVRPYPEDAIYGPVTRAGDYADGPALAGLRRAGPDLAWVADRYPGRSQMEVRLAVHNGNGVAPFPWLFGNGGLMTADGSAVVDYLLQLRSSSEVQR